MKADDLPAERIAGTDLKAEVTTAAGTGAPRATLRLQMHRGFDFDAAAAQVPYLSRLGISHVYTSPILCARAGSTHGYDVVDPTRVNPELGGEDGLRRLVSCLREHRMGLIVDIVPNHMAVGGSDNPWWLDVLEWGRDSIYARFFDIDWDAADAELSGKVLAPFLGNPYGEALAAGDVVLRFDSANGRLYFSAHDTHRFPLSPNLYGPLLRVAPGDALSELARRFRESLGGNRTRLARRGAFEDACANLAEAARTPAVLAALEQLLAGYAGSEDAQTRLHRLLDRQHFRLAWWRTAPDEINWRRFFDVTDLAGMRIQDTATFEAVHATIFRLYGEGVIDGVRVDHVDGLADPRAYCRKLRNRLDSLSARRPDHLPRGPAYFVVEKILAPGEKLARDWRTDGTSGYVFMNESSAVLHDPEGRVPLAALWRECSGRTADFEAEEREARRRIPQLLFSADFNACAHALHRIARSDPRTRDWTLAAIRRALTEMLVHFPVYRTYADARGRSAADAAIMAQVVSQAQRTGRPAERALLELIDRWLGAEPAENLANPVERRDRLRALARFQQLTSPVAAKSVEDTAFYRFGVLLSRNEVGANPGQFAMTADEFHAACTERRHRYPAAMLATATHDHKRGEDLRARLAVLSEIPTAWREAVSEWRRRNESRKEMLDHVRGPDATDEYVLYQMLVGAWPLQVADDEAEDLSSLGERLAEWQRKAVREAKRRSGWVEPNLAYEQVCENFLKHLLDPARAADFLAELKALVARIAAPGAVNGLAQTLLRLTTPGVPDTYQGTEFWDFSLVDPDNRRPVNFAQRAAALAQSTADEELLKHWRDGRIKQRLIARTLALRRQMPDLFALGSYVPLRVRGQCAQHVLAFLREQGGRAVLVAIPMRTANLRPSPDDLNLPPSAWGNTRICLPARHAQAGWCDALGGNEVASGRELGVSTLFARWPLALVYSAPAADAQVPGAQNSGA
ncbi:MAG: malto-oligosyltrehalose synthase [Panacagrimonas sp.]